jgi:hypothetical protein
MRPMSTRLLCPFHREQTPSCVVRDGRYYCFGCGASGPATDLPKELGMGETRRAALEQQRLQLIAYERMKLEAGDQHGVADAAMDIRELEARLDERERMEDSGYTKDSPVLQAVLDAIAGTLDPHTQIADHPNVKFAQMQRLKLLQEGAASQLQTTIKLREALQPLGNQAQSSNLGAGMWPPTSSAVDPTAYNPPMPWEFPAGLTPMPPMPPMPAQGAGLFGPAVAPKERHHSMADALSDAADDGVHPPQCSATVMGGPCVMVEGHQGAHMNADLWRAEAH